MNVICKTPPSSPQDITRIAFSLVVLPFTIAHAGASPSTSSIGKDGVAQKSLSSLADSNTIKRNVTGKLSVVQDRKLVCKELYG